MKSAFPTLMIGIIVGFLLFWSLEDVVSPDRETVVRDTVEVVTPPLPPVYVPVPTKPVQDTAAVQAALALADSALAEAASARELVAELMLKQTAKTPFTTSKDGVTVSGALVGEYVPPLRQMLLGVEVSSVQYPRIEVTTMRRPPAWVGPALGASAFAAGVLVNDQKYLQAGLCAALSITLYEVYL